MELQGLAGFVEAPPDWEPALRAVDPQLVEWPRIVAVLPDAVDVPQPVGVRRLAAPDADAVAGLTDPAISWISETWDGPAGLAASGCAWGAFADGRLVSVAVSFYVGGAHEDIGVVTEGPFRGRGLSTACGAGLIGDIRRRGRRPTWTTSPDNAGSRGVAARLGFVPERDDVLYAVRTPVPAS
jgi:predicted GNAT family acetyltransferase